MNGIVRAKATILNRRQTAPPRPDLSYCFQSGLCPSDLPAPPRTERGLVSTTERKRREERERIRREEEALQRASEAEKKRLEEIEIRHMMDQRELHRVAREVKLLSEERSLAALKVKEQKAQQSIAILKQRQTEQIKIQEKQQRQAQEKLEKRNTLAEKYTFHINMVESNLQQQQQQQNT